MILGIDNYQVYLNQNVIKEKGLETKWKTSEDVFRWWMNDDNLEGQMELSDFIGSTSQIIDYATKSENNTFIICTEMGVFYELHQKNPEKKFYSVGHRQFCPNMKMVRLEGVKEALETMQPEVNLDEEMRQKAALPLEKMLKLAAQ